MPKLHLHPSLPDGPDPGDGGIRQVIRHQRAHLPSLGWDLVDHPADADVIACHAEVPESYLRLYPDKALVVHNHGAYWTEYEWNAQWCYTSNAHGMAAIRAADITTAVSDWTANALRRHSARDIRVVHHGVDVDEWTPAPARRPYVLWNKTRTDPVCDVDPLNAVARLLPDVQFVSTFGDAAHNVLITGRLPYDDSRRLIRGAAVYLCTTRETFGIGTLEAMACGVPVVGYNWGGQREIVRDGTDGYLVTPGNAVELAAAIRHALADRDRLSEGARSRAAEFRWERAAAQYSAIYHEAMERARARADGPAVSVIVPAYGLDRYLGDTLRSVAQQTYQSWECIVVDDASPDRCGAIADEWAARDPRFRVIHNATNQYLAESRNIGIAAARGRYIMPLDADDMLTPDTLETLARALDQDRSISTAYGNVMFFEEDGATPIRYHQRYAPGHSGWPMEFNLDLQLTGPGQLLPYASMYRREVWSAVGGYRRRSRSSEDCEFWLRTTSYGFAPRMVTTGDTLIYRVRPDSMSSAGQEGWEEHRAWFPWVEDRTLLPAAAVRDLAPELTPYPSLEPIGVSVVIPVGPGHQQYLQDAIDSVDAQTYRRWECIVVNDSGAPLPGVPSWVRVVEPPDGRERFGGVAAARNAGIRASSAPLFLPLDADDILQPRAIELMVAAYDDAGECRPVVYPDFWGEIRPGEYEQYLSDDYDVSIMDGRKRIAHGSQRSGAPYAVTALTPRVYWEAAGGYDESLPAWEDWGFAIQLAAQRRCARRVAAPLFTYRKHTGQRRDGNYAAFDESRRGMLEKDFGLGMEGLMPCRTCGGSQPTFGAALGGGPGVPPADGAQLIEYTGERLGAVNYRAPSGVVYRFSKGADSRKYVRAEDIDYFISRSDFRVAQETSVVDAARTDAPVIVASRSPGWADHTQAPSPDATPGPIVESSDPVIPGAVSIDALFEDVDPSPAAVDVVQSPSVDGDSDPEADRRVLAVLSEYGSRTDLNAAAAALGVAGADRLPNKTAVAAAIVAMREMRGV